MGKSTISMAMFNSFLYVYQRVNIQSWMNHEKIGDFTMKKYGLNQENRELTPSKFGNFTICGVFIVKIGELSPIGCT